MDQTSRKQLPSKKPDNMCFRCNFTGEALPFVALWSPRLRLQSGSRFHWCWPLAGLRPQRRMFQNRPQKEYWWANEPLWYRIGMHSHHLVEKRQSKQLKWLFNDQKMRTHIWKAIIFLASRTEGNSSSTVIWKSSQSFWCNVYDTESFSVVYNHFFAHHNFAYSVSPSLRVKNFQAETLASKEREGWARKRFGRETLNLRWRLKTFQTRLLATHILTNWFLINSAQGAQSAHALLPSHSIKNARAHSLQGWFEFWAQRLDSHYVFLII